MDGAPNPHGPDAAGPRLRPRVLPSAAAAGWEGWVPRTTGNPVAAKEITTNVCLALADHEYGGELVELIDLKGWDKGWGDLVATAMAPVLAETFRIVPATAAGLPVGRLVAGPHTDATMVLARPDVVRALTPPDAGFDLVLALVGPDEVYAVPDLAAEQLDALIAEVEHRFEAGRPGAIPVLWWAGDPAASAWCQPWDTPERFERLRRLWARYQVGQWAAQERATPPPDEPGRWAEVVVNGIGTTIAVYEQGVEPLVGWVDCLHLRSAAGETLTVPLSGFRQVCDARALWMSDLLPRRFWLDGWPDADEWAQLAAFDDPSDISDTPLQEAP